MLYLLKSFENNFYNLLMLDSRDSGREHGLDDSRLLAGGVDWMVLRILVGSALPGSNHEHLQ